jgi:hypothetical protein
MTLLQNQILINFLITYGLFSFFTTILGVIILLRNYYAHKDIFFSLKDIQIEHYLKEIDLLKENNKNIQNNYEKIQKENDELSQIIINKIK